MIRQAVGRIILPFVLVITPPLIPGRGAVKGQVQIAPLAVAGVGGGTVGYIGVEQDHVPGLCS